MTKNLPVPTNKVPGIPGGDLTATAKALESVPSIINSISAIVESNNNRKVQLASIYAQHDVQIKKLEMDFQIEYKRLDIKSQVMTLAFQSDKFSGDQILEMYRGI